ncbi:hypothetical protein HPB50_005513 [Hyalomma asiaticum]|uniref:Uncharacterized protein n=1 Tax=Hyalomma asiaticum TaxID=266040 RepID=A0ACB7S6Q9_HYAAI|nr:hypothetical protein HPB50_005513 [Hyalomma asiaticum]
MWNDSGTIPSPEWQLRNTGANEIFLQEINLTDKEPFVVIGEFNAPSRHWGYHYEKARGRNLAEPFPTLRLMLLTEPAYLTRVENSVTRDTWPDLSPKKCC